MRNSVSDYFKTTRFQELEAFINLHLGAHQVVCNKLYFTHNIPIKYLAIYGTCYQVSCISPLSFQCVPAFLRKDKLTSYCYRLCARFQGTHRNALHHICNMTDILAFSSISTCVNLDFPFVSCNKTTDTI